MIWLKSQLKVRWQKIWWVFMWAILSMNIVEGIGKLYFGDEWGLHSLLIAMWIGLFMFMAYINDDQRGLIKRLFVLLKDGSELTSNALKGWTESEKEKGLWLIWSQEHSAWWCPLEKGYTKERRNAGTYSYRDACRIVESANINLKDEPNEAMVKYIEPTK